MPGNSKTVISVISNYRIFALYKITPPLLAAPPLPTSSPSERREASRRDSGARATRGTPARQTSPRGATRSTKRYPWSTDRTEVPSGRHQQLCQPRSTGRTDVPPRRRHQHEPLRSISPLLLTLRRNPGSHWPRRKSTKRCCQIRGGIYWGNARYGGKGFDSIPPQNPREIHVIHRWGKAMQVQEYKTIRE